MSRRALVVALLIPLLVLGGPPVLAHDEPASSTYDLLVPGDFMSGSITFVTLVGPPAGEEVLHTTFQLTFTSPAGGTPASEIVLELSLPVDGTSKTWVLHGSDLGWPTATGTFSGSVGSDQLNGVLDMGLFGFSTPELVMGSNQGGLTGQYVNSTIRLELAGECQQDLGFAGPGAVTLSICGDALGSGGTAILSAEGAPAFAPVYLVVGVDPGAVPFKGGLLVPVPVLLVVPLVADGTGVLALPFHGGGGPVTAYVQAVVPDGAQPAGFALSNALQVELLP
jgi:hypothetical protein